MFSKLTIFAIAMAALLFSAPSMARASESLRFPTFQLPQVPVTQAPASQLPGQSPAQESESKKKFLLVLKLDDNQINRLRAQGSLSTSIPPKFVNRVGAIRFQRSVSFLSDPLKVVSAKTDKQNRAMSIEIDNTVLERLAYQPVEIAIYESGFDRVQMTFNPRGMIAGKLPAEFPPSINRSGSPYMYVRINSQRGIYGSLKNLEKLLIKTQFGKVSVPTKEIAGIRFNDGAVNRVFVVLKKGDVFSGEIGISTISVVSRWGDRKLKISELESLTLSREIVFLQDAINRKRWQLQSLLTVNAQATNSSLNRNNLGPRRPSPASPLTPSQVPPATYPQPQYRTPIGFPN